MNKHKNNIKMDNKYRICLGSFLSKEERDQLSSFQISRKKDGKIVLDPQVEIPARDHWIYKDPKKMASLQKGIKDTEEGRLHDLGSFAQYAKDDENND